MIRWQHLAETPTLKSRPQGTWTKGEGPLRQTGMHYEMENALNLPLAIDRPFGDRQSHCRLSMLKPV
ncbi:hypothetical protein GCM10023333_02040 [Ferrimonas pelagia]|uniref:Uncharacterized protein n=1 Tax=Ferrimonas pelagia TaxID=1177826 RepID=A0ABP9EAP1_9GAMM